MQRSENISQLAAALAKAQSVMTGALRDSENPHFRSRYADLASVWEACREPLSSNGLSVAQLPGITDRGTVTVETILLHESGEFIGGTIEIPAAKSDAQAIGSALTYARRYSLAAVVGIAPEDDDAEGAVGRGNAPGKKGPAPKKEGGSPPPPEKTAPPPNAEATDAKTEEYHERIRGALRRLFSEDKEAALTHVEKLSTWTDKETGEVKAAGVKDYRRIKGKRLEILCHNLEAEVKKMAAASSELTGSEEDPF